MLSAIICNSQIIDDFTKSSRSDDHGPSRKKNKAGDQRRFSAAAREKAVGKQIQGGYYAYMENRKILGEKPILNILDEISKTLQMMYGII